MKRKSYLVVIIAFAVVVSGCYTTGLSMREKGSFNYTNLVYGLYDGDEAARTESVKLEKPIRLAVAQVGENAPPEAMLNVLADKKYLISKMAIIPASSNESNYYTEQKVPTQQEFSKRMKGMRNLAKDMGTDYIFLFGGSADYGTTASWLQLLDLTVVGGFIIPSNKIKAEGRAVGALINVDTGKVIFMVNSEDKIEKNMPTYLAYDQQEAVVVNLRDKLVEKITNNFIEELIKYNQS